MTLKQFDTLYLKLDELSKRVTSLEEQLTLTNKLTKQLTDKTIVITSLDQDIEKLKIDIASLIDEKEA